MILMRHGESEFNVVYKRTRVDPGIRDPKLTPLGRHQVAEASAHLDGRRIARILTSPYTRAIETASIVAERIAIADPCRYTHRRTRGICVRHRHKRPGTSPRLAHARSRPRG